MLFQAVSQNPQNYRAWCLIALAHLSRGEALNVCAAHGHIISSEEKDVRFHRGECLTRFDQPTLVGKSAGVKIRGERDAQRLMPRDACMDLCGGNSEPALKSE